MKSKLSNQGFTLIELIVVIVLIGIVAAVAAPKFIDISSDARKSALIGVEANFKAGLQLVRMKQQFIDNRLPSHDSRQYWIDMNNNGVVDGDTSNNQNSFEGRDGVDILAFNNGEIDNYQLHKLVSHVDGVIMQIAGISTVDIGYDFDADGDIADDGCYIQFHQINGFTRHLDDC